MPRPATGSATSVVTVDLMAKAGVCFPEAHLDAAKMSDLAAAAFLEIGFDNVMPLFSVCHESAAMGCRVDWGKRDLMPSMVGRHWNITDEVRIPSDVLPRREARVPLDAIATLKRRLGDQAAVVGKVFGPWTLGYHVFTVEDFLINTILAADLVKRAIERLKELTVLYGLAQIEAGADALCLADHATRDLCSPAAYHEFLRDVHAELVARLPVPLILHICGDTSDRIADIAGTGIACLHFDSRVPSAEARCLAGDKMALMGGTSNFSIIREGMPQSIAADVREKAASGIDIIGPECAVPLDAPYRNMQVLTEEVRRLTHD